MPCLGLHDPSWLLDCIVCGVRFVRWASFLRPGYGLFPGFRIRVCRHLSLFRGSRRAFHFCGRQPATSSPATYRDSDTFRRSRERRLFVPPDITGNKKKHSSIAPFFGAPMCRSWRSLFGYLQLSVRFRNRRYFPGFAFGYRETPRET